MIAARRPVPLEGPLDLRATLWPLVVGPRDPTQRVGVEGAVRASRTPDGPATLLVTRPRRDALEARAFGPGAEWMLEHAPDWLGLGDGPVDPERAIPAAPPALRSLARRARGVRLPRTRRILELLVPVVLEQKVAGKEAARAFRNLVLRFSEPAPGPFAGLRLPLSAERLATLPTASFIPLGVPPRQGAVLRELGRRARRLEEADDMVPADAERRLRSLPGIGAWSAGSALLRGMGCADAVPVGDYNLPALVAWNLAGEPRADDARMLELLEPYRGQRGRVVRWLMAAGRFPARRAPRRPLRPLPSQLPA